MGEKGPARPGRKLLHSFFFFLSFPHGALASSSPMAAALAAAGLGPPPPGLDPGLDEDIEAALAAAGVGGGTDWGAALLQPATQASIAPPPPPLPGGTRPPPGPPHPTGRAPLPQLAEAGALASSSAPAPALRFNADALAAMRNRKGPLLRAMIAEHARRGVR
jgi:hypothetical protein